MTCLYFTLFYTLQLLSSTTSSVTKVERARMGGIRLWRQQGKSYLSLFNIKTLVFYILYF